MPLESFQASIQVLQFPPQLEAIQSALETRFQPQGVQVLQWAIVSTQRETRTLQIEGTCLTTG